MPLFTGISRRQPGSGSNSQLNATLAKQNANVREKAHLKRTLSTIEKDSLRYKVGQAKPWLDEDGHVIWTRARIAIAEWVLSQSFETVMGVIIATNIVVMVVETNADAGCITPSNQSLKDCSSRSTAIPWLQAVNLILLIVYSIECCLRAFVERAGYLWNRWNQIDLLTVTLGWTAFFLAEAMFSGGVNLNLMRIIRVVRLMRAARVVISIPEFYILVSGLTSSFKAILFGSVMLISVILVWAIIAVELLHPLNSSIEHHPTCLRCYDAFKSVQEASLTIFQQIVAGDSWGQINVPLAVHYMEQDVWTGLLIGIILFFIMMTISLGCMNLILAVIVERATEARENDQQRKAQKKDAEREANMVELALLCDSMDVDGNGSLSCQEMLDGYDHNLQFNALMQQMDIRRTDIQTIFSVLDGDCSGEVSYVEFCQQLGTCRKRDPIMMNSLIKYSVMELQKSIQHDVLETLREHTEALVEHREMLQESLELLYALPLDPKVKEAAQKKRASRVLRRQGKRQGKPQFFDEVGVAQAYSISERSEGTVNGMDAHQVINSLESTCQSFQETQLQMESLIQHAEELAAKASPAPPQTGGIAIDPREASDAPVPAPPVPAIPSDDLEKKFSILLNKLQERMTEEDVLQRRCKDAMRLIEEIRTSQGRYFHC